MRLSGSVKLRWASLLAALFALFLRLLLSLNLGFGSRLGLKGRLGLTDLREPLFLIRDPSGHLIAALVLAESFVLLCVRRFGGGQPAVHLGLKLRLALFHAPIAHGLVLGGLGLDLGPIQRNMAELRKPRHLRKLQHLQKQARQRLQMALAELADGPEVRRIERNDHHEVCPIEAGLRDQKNKARWHKRAARAPSSSRDRKAAGPARLNNLPRSQRGRGFRAPAPR